MKKKKRVRCIDAFDMVRLHSSRMAENGQGQKYKTRNVMGHTVKLDPDVYYNPQILNSTLMLGPGHHIVVRKRKKDFFLSRFILKAKKGQMVDHINRNPLDNRRCNLRIASPRQNVLNRILRSNTGYIGVSKILGRSNYLYHASFRLKGGKRKTFSGPFTPEGLILAAIARDKFVIEAGDDEFAPLNFPCFKYEPFRSFLLRSDLDELKQAISSQG